MAYKELSRLFQLGFSPDDLSSNKETFAYCLGSVTRLLSQFMFVLEIESGRERVVMQCIRRPTCPVADDFIKLGFFLFFRVYIFFSFVTALLTG